MSEWVVYIVQCADNSLYTGITTDIQRRLNEHNSDVKGARYTRTRRPVKLVYCQSFENRSQASKQECTIKQLSRSQKIKFITRTSIDMQLTKDISL